MAKHDRSRKETAALVRQVYRDTLAKRIDELSKVEVDVPTSARGLNMAPVRSLTLMGPPKR